jgi:hypothetical protein
MPTSSVDPHELARLRRPHALGCPIWWAEELQPGDAARCTCYPDPPLPPIRTVAQLAAARDRMTRQYRWSVRTRWGAM